mgnify:CR=1 FL=1
MQKWYYKLRAVLYDCFYSTYEVSYMLLKRFLFSPVFAVLFYAVLALPPAWAVMRGWQKPLQPGAPSRIESILPHPLEPGRLIAASSGELRVTAEDNPESWSTVARIPSSRPVLEIKTFPSLPNDVFVLTEDAIFQASLKSPVWRKVFDAFGEGEKVLSFEVVFARGLWFTGTSSSLLVSADEGKSWTRSDLVPERTAFPVLRAAEGRLFIATDRSLYRADAEENAEKIFSFPSAEVSDEESAEPLVSRCRIADLIIHPADPATVWLGSDDGVFETKDGGRAWKLLSRSGLKAAKIRRLVYAPLAGKLAAGTTDGIYLFDAGRDLWTELYRGSAGREPTDMQIFIKGGEETLLAITNEGLAFHPLASVEFNSPQDPVSNAGLALLEQLFRLEPTARELQLAVIRYANADSSKIRRWQKESRLKSLMPSFSFGKSYSTANSIDLDRGSTSEPDEYILGPQDIDEGWDMDMSWDFSDLVFSGDQTSIDSREKLMIEMRHDLLGEATRIYFERRRLQMQIILSDSASAQEHLELLTRMDELTSLLDGMSGGYFGAGVQTVYENRPELEQLWSIASLEGRPMV